MRTLFVKSHSKFSGIAKIGLLVFRERTRQGRDEIV